METYFVKYARWYLLNERDDKGISLYLLYIIALENLNKILIFSYRLSILNYAHVLIESLLLLYIAAYTLFIVKNTIPQRPC